MKAVFFGLHCTSNAFLHTSHCATLLLIESIITFPTVQCSVLNSKDEERIALFSAVKSHAKEDIQDIHTFANFLKTYFTRWGNKTLKSYYLQKLPTMLSCLSWKRFKCIEPVLGPYFSFRRLESRRYTLRNEDIYLFHFENQWNDFKSMTFMQIIRDICTLQLRYKACAKKSIVPGWTRFVHPWSGWESRQ